MKLKDKSHNNQTQLFKRHVLHYVVRSGHVMILIVKNSPKNCASRKANLYIILAGDFVGADVTAFVQL